MAADLGHRRLVRRHGIERARQRRQSRDQRIMQHRHRQEDENRVEQGETGRDQPEITQRRQQHEGGRGQDEGVERQAQPHSQAVFPGLSHRDCNPSPGVEAGLKVRPAPRPFPKPKAGC